MIPLPHEHAWRDLPDATPLGFYSKRNDPKDVRWYLGKAQECACGALVFWPKGYGKPQEAEPVDLDTTLKETLP